MSLTLSYSSYAIALQIVFDYSTFRRSKFGRKQTHLFRPTISTSTVCLVVSSAVSILCFSESLHLKPSKHTVYNIKTWLLTGAVLVLVERVFKSSPS